MNLRRAIEKALDGDAILFVGAGFSCGAINLQREKFKRGDKLARHLSSKADISERTQLEDAAESYAEKFGTDKLIEFIQNEFTVMKIAPFHQQIASIPWKRIYTTNYDNIIETAFRSEGKRLSPITLSHDIYKIPKDHTICIHLNGYVESLDREKIWNELKLTESSYITASIAESPWAMLFRQDIKLAQAIFFIGYSLFDLDIKRILSETEYLKEKCFFYVGKSPDETTVRRVKKFGNIILEGAKDFIKKKEDVEVNYIPRSSTEISLYSIHEYSTQSIATAISDKSFLDLLLFGKRTNELILESLRTGDKFYLERSLIEDVLNKIESGLRIFVISSDLGNGKSMFLEGLRLRAAEHGYRVFDVYERNENIGTELEYVAKLEGNILLTMEEYQNWTDEIRIFCMNANENAVLVLTARNAVHDVMIDELYSSTGADNIIEINIDLLDEQEIEWIIETLDEYGLWGKRAGQGKFEKKRFLTTICKKQLHAILLKLLESPDIGHRLSEIAERLKQKGENYQVLLSILILTLLNYGATADILTDIWGANVISNPDFRKDPLVKEFISFNYYAALVRSPIAAEYLIRKSVDGGTITKVLSKMVEKIIAGSKISPRYRDIFKSLVRFSVVQSLFPEKGKRKAIINYYESIRNLDSCKFSPLFWLQYAIACLVEDEIRQSKIYFETAYSIARKKGWKTFQIDNHYARFLMVEATQELDYPDVMGSFRKARDIINRQIRDERRHYPYRVATSYQKFIDRFGSKLKNGEIKEVQQSAINVLDKIATLPDHRREHRYVANCKVALEYVVSRCIELLS